MSNIEREHRNNLVSPERLTQFMRSFSAEPGQRIGKNIVVDNFPLTSKEIREERKRDRMAVFNPDVGWLWIEASIDAPNLNTTQRGLEEKFKKEGRRIQSLKTYKIGGEISKLLTGRYFDEGPTWSRVLDSCHGGGVLRAFFSPSGRLNVPSDPNPEARLEDLGERSEEVIKP